MKMSMHTRRVHRLSLALTVAAFASTASLAAEPDTTPQLTIRADRPVTKVDRSSSGIPVQQYELSYHVSYADLDLATSIGADALKARVYKAANQLCKDLDKLYPMADTDPSCARKAENDASKQVTSAIKLAQAGKAKVQ